MYGWGDRWDSNPRMPEPQSGALDHFATTAAIRIGRGSRSRTHTNGFGDRCSTIKLCPCGRWWRVMDSNHRTRMGADLQSAAFDHFANPPRCKSTWCRREDLNPQPTDYKSVALPIELRRQTMSKVRSMVARDGIEPPTRGFSVLCSTN